MFFVLSERYWDNFVKHVGGSAPCGEASEYGIQFETDVRVH